MCEGNIKNIHGLDRCKTKHKHSSGLDYAYSFKRSEYSEKELIKAYKDFNKKFENRIIN